MILDSCACSEAPATLRKQRFRPPYGAHSSRVSGRDVRLEEEEVTGYALIGEEGVLHAAAFAA